MTTKGVGVKEWNEKKDEDKKDKDGIDRASGARALCSLECLMENDCVFLFFVAIIIFR
jgi:hypothetical protein